MWAKSSGDNELHSKTNYVKRVKVKWVRSIVPVSGSRQTPDRQHHIVSQMRGSRAERVWTRPSSACVNLQNGKIDTLVVTVSATATQTTPGEVCPPCGGPQAFLHHGDHEPICPGQTFSTFPGSLIKQAPE